LAPVHTGRVSLAPQPGPVKPERPLGRHRPGRGDTAPMSALARTDNA